ncbi:molybdate ABC transporter substrate-binding protein [Bradyrhizobium cenepequi]|uniref:molybdate ABC transporter substrate-binding protein n=1 Tax=Bradyrhizobium cenepequi TaxID=2821403 RepID=UPI00201BC899
MKLANRAEALQMPSVAKSSTCNPADAPYGATAVQVMEALGLREAIQPKLVDAASITHEYQFEISNAELGFVAPTELTNSETGSRWLMAPEFCGPIRQDAVLLETGADNQPTRAFVDFLKGPKVHAIIARYGNVQG